MCSQCILAKLDLEARLVEWEKEGKWIKNGTVWRPDPPILTRLIWWPWYVKLYAWFWPRCSKWFRTKIPYPEELYKKLPWFDETYNNNQFFAR